MDRARLHEGKRQVRFEQIFDRWERSEPSQSEAAALLRIGNDNGVKWETLSLQFIVFMRKNHQQRPWRWLGRARPGRGRAVPEPRAVSLGQPRPISPGAIVAGIKSGPMPSGRPIAASQASNSGAGFKPRAARTYSASWNDVLW